MTGVAQKASWTGNFDPATDRYLNVAAFTLPATGTFGTGGQYLPNVFGFFYMNENLSLAKNTRIKERLALDLRLETFNTFNRVVFGNGGTDISNPSAFGKVTNMANSPRNAQIAIKLVF